MACARFCLSAKAFPSVCFRAGSTALSAAGSGVRTLLENKAGLWMAERRLQGLHLSLRACKGLVFKQEQLFSLASLSQQGNCSRTNFYWGYIKNTGLMSALTCFGTCRLDQERERLGQKLLSAVQIKHTPAYRYILPNKQPSSIFSNFVHYFKV